MKVRDLMRKNPRTVQLDTPVETVWDLISSKQFYMLPVLDSDGYIKGIITAEDLLANLIPDYREFFSNFYPQAPKFKDIEAKIEKQLGLVAADVMNETVYTVYEYHDVFKALSRMIAYNVRVLPVTNKRELLVGFIVEKDIFTYLLEKQKNILEKVKKQQKAGEQLKEKGSENRGKTASLADAFKEKSSKYFSLLGSKLRRQK